MMNANHYGHMLHIRTQSDELLATAVLTEIRDSEASLNDLSVRRTVTYSELRAIYTAIFNRAKSLGFVVCEVRTDIARTVLNQWDYTETGRFTYMVNLMQPLTYADTSARIKATVEA